MSILARHGRWREVEQLLVKCTFAVAKELKQVMEVPTTSQPRATSRASSTQGRLRLGGMGGSFGRPLPSPLPSVGGAGTTPISRAPWTSGSSSGLVNKGKGLVFMINGKGTTFLSTYFYDIDKEVFVVH